MDGPNPVIRPYRYLSNRHPLYFHCRHWGRWALPSPSVHCAPGAGSHPRPYCQLQSKFEVGVLLPPSELVKHRHHYLTTSTHAFIFDSTHVALPIPSARRGRHRFVVLDFDVKRSSGWYLRHRRNHSAARRRASISAPRSLSEASSERDRSRRGRRGHRSPCENPSTQPGVQPVQDGPAPTLRIGTVRLPRRDRQVRLQVPAEGADGRRPMPRRGPSEGLRRQVPEVQLSSVQDYGDKRREMQSVLARCRCPRILLV
ncbi:hypothetical protein ACHAWF_013594 [Thalassiosira exigua]